MRRLNGDNDFFSRRDDSVKFLTNQGVYTSYRIVIVV